MREIKFRAWIAKDNEMQYGVSLNSLGQHAQQGEDAIIMQYTGLKDKNGKEIYEGDILEWTEDRNIKCEVKYNAPSFEYFWNDAKITLDRGCYADYSDIEVIGNIYENPELINKEKGI